MTMTGPRHINGARFHFPSFSLEFFGDGNRTRISVSDPETAFNERLRISLNMGNNSDYVILVGPLLMRSFLYSAVLIVVASSNVHATEALFFNGGGYTIEILVGYLDDPVIAQVRFTPPGAKDSVSLPRDLLRIEKFDMEKRVLTLQFSNKNNPDLPGSFSLSVKETRAVLSISGEEIKSEFNWDI